MANYITTESDLTQVANAIRAKGNTSAQLEYPDDFVTAIQNLPAPVPMAAQKDVNFIDYDGTILYSYTISEFQGLTVLPANPTHSGLISQGWNWTLSDAKAEVNTYGELWIGQLYVTESGATEIDILLDEFTLDPYLCLGISGTININWGDGNSENFTGTYIYSGNYIQHHYAAPGPYTISISSVSGRYTFFTDGTYCTLLSKSTSSTSENYLYSNKVKAIRLGAYEYNLGINGIFDYGLNNCSSLEYITMTSNINLIDCDAFYNCCSLKSITIPSTAGQIGEYGGYIFYGNYSLRNISLPKNQTIANSFQMFYLTRALQSVILSPTLTTIQSYMFGGCDSLSSITIPSTVTSFIGNANIQGCSSLAELRFNPTTPPPVADSNAFNIPAFCKIFVPVDSYHSYITGTNYPSSSTYTYIGFKTYANNATLPNSVSFTPGGETISYTATWYATKKDAINQTNAITIGNGKEIYARLVESAAGYTVTVSLTNPSHPDAFIDCDIYEALSNDITDLGNTIGSISSPTGSTEITVPASVYRICVVFSGSSMYTDISNCTCTGGVSVEETDYAGAFLFSVSGNGTITIDGVEYAD